MNRKYIEQEVQLMIEELIAGIPLDVLAYAEDKCRGTENMIPRRVYEFESFKFTSKDIKKQILEKNARA